jgi:hypothetical protein
MDGNPHPGINGVEAMGKKLFNVFPGGSGESFDVGV